MRTLRELLKEVNLIFFELMYKRIVQKVDLDVPGSHKQSLYSDLPVVIAFPYRYNHTQ